MLWFVGFFLVVVVDGDDDDDFFHLVSLTVKCGMC